MMDAMMKTMTMMMTMNDGVQRGIGFIVLQCTLQVIRIPCRVVNDGNHNNIGFDNEKTKTGASSILASCLKSHPSPKGLGKACVSMRLWSHIGVAC